LRRLAVIARNGYWPLKAPPLRAKRPPSRLPLLTPSKVFEDFGIEIVPRVGFCIAVRVPQIQITILGKERHALSDQGRTPTPLQPPAVDAQALLCAKHQCDDPLLEFGSSVGRCPALAKAFGVINQIGDVALSLRTQQGAKFLGLSAVSTSDRLRTLMQPLHMFKGFA